MEIIYKGTFTIEKDEENNYQLYIGDNQYGTDFQLYGKHGNYKLDSIGGYSHEHIFKDIKNLIKLVNNNIKMKQRHG